MDMENEVVDQVEETVETPQETPAPEETAPEETQEAAGSEEPETEAEGEQGEAAEEPEGETEGEEDETSDTGYKPSTKFKISAYNKETKKYDEKEFEIDKRFHSLMKTPEDEKAIRDLHEKAFALDSYKDRFNDTKAVAEHYYKESSSIKNQIQEARSIYREAVQTQNWHKLDRFFGKLEIPQDVVLQYALAKVQLNQMPEAERTAILTQLQAEEKAQLVSTEKMQVEEQLMEQRRQVKAIQLDMALTQPDTQALVQAFEEQTGTPGSFKELVRKEGNLAWLNEGLDLTPEQAIQRVVQSIGLKPKSPASPGSQARTAQPNQNGAPSPQKKAVQRTTQTIPNITGRGSASPLKQKPRSIEDLKKIYQEM